MADGCCVLSAFVHRELVVLPLRDCGDQLDWVVVLGRGAEPRVDFDRSPRKRLVRVAGNNLGKKALQRRVLVEDLGLRRIELDGDGFRQIRGPDQRDRLDRHFKPVAHHERDRLAAIGDDRR
jgi:hypothetical protein